tara:strand:+ start:43 stop:192 length:150 start_codon:yes stop_codon:yes gene_type:complete
MSNNRGNITIAKRTALKDIAEYMKDKLIQSWCANILYEECTKLNKALGI